ncbi:tRNA pseudouridine(13) synthase TruD [Shewanella waksmanii]|uniref:tRNA pseudouridine(13) synthase TruD n=1 Tax=Shewanella waksmanii TaxID=213783 RepID=UPI000490E512|nr:tRNA pseudouridine(13) synthase TruD [Shewanella waksmanii]
MTDLAYLHGEPSATADIRTSNADLLVQEILPFLPSGEGEHHLIHIRKDGLNTADVAKKISSFAGVHPKEVTVAGQKDKNAITEQWFGVRIPGKETPDWQQLNSEQITVLSSGRHIKKLRTGALSGNRFTITLRKVSDPQAVVARLELIKQHGVPNYFGEQRFGHNGKNLVFGRQMLSGKRVKDRNKRSFYLSAVRSNLFNQHVAARIASHGTDTLTGDCVMLAGTRSYFVAEQWDDTLVERLQRRDIVLSCPLWGRGSALAQGDAAQFEAQVAEPFNDDCIGLEKAGLDQERRALLLQPEQLSYQVSDDTVVIKFALPAGCFATSVLREVAVYEDVNAREYALRQQQQLEQKND